MGCCGWFLLPAALAATAPFFMNHTRSTRLAVTSSLL
jgi:hypothetical protein